MQSWHDQPIPEPNNRGTALDYHNISIDVNSEMNKEPLVDVVAFNIAARPMYARVVAPYYKAFETARSTVYVRLAVADKLVAINRKLKIHGVEVLILDGFRPITLQRELWQHFLAKGKELLPGATEGELVQFAGQFCSDPGGFDPADYKTWPVHTTGGAIDVTLRTLEDEQELFMGGIFDDADAISSTRYFESSDFTSQSALEAKRNRRLLWHAMLSEQFTNYPYEWWHFDYGTQMWASNVAHSAIPFYGTTAVP